MKKSSFISFIGEPNSGKSTLFNALIGEKISIVTTKMHTTRENIKGLLTKDNKQLVFIDTPGFVDKYKGKLEKVITGRALVTINSVDFLCIIVDVNRNKPFNGSLFNMQYYAKTKNPPILVLNKVDLLKDKTKLLEIANTAKDLGFNNIFMISAKKNKGVEDLKNYFLGNSTAEGWFFEPNVVTDRSMKQLAEDITRENLYKMLNAEIPYSLTVLTDFWEENQESVTIYQSITVLKDTQKKIVLGKHGNLLKKISALSKCNMENVIGKTVELNLFVKIDKKWMDKEIK